MAKVDELKELPTPPLGNNGCTWNKYIPSWCQRVYLRHLAGPSVGCGLQEWSDTLQLKLSLHIAGR